MRWSPTRSFIPAFDAPLRTAFRREMEMFVDSVFREDRSVVDLLSANYTFVNERLAAHYGIQNVRGDQFRRVTLTDPNRFGLLGKGAVLMVTAYPNRTSPVLRGAYILENIAGTPPSPPPPNVEAFKENKEGEKPKTIREIMETHRANPTCNACHGVMDPLGFSLENFDTIGAYRSMDRYTRTKIDTSGKLVDGTAVNGPSDLRNALLKHPEQFAQTFTEKMMTYALGRGVEYFDMPSVRKIVKDAKRDNYKFSSIVMGIVNAPAFQSSTVEPPAGAQLAAKSQVAKKEPSNVCYQEAPDAPLGTAGSGHRTGAAAARRHDSGAAPRWRRPRRSHASLGIHLLPAWRGDEPLDTHGRRPDRRVRRDPEAARISTRR